MKKIKFIIIGLLCCSFMPVDRVSERFSAPSNYRVINNSDDSFADWLGKLPLKPEGTPTRTYRGDIARTNAYTAGIVDISVGNQDLQQCADAVIRLRAEYLYRRKQYNSISFNFTNGFKCDYQHYADGYRFNGKGWQMKAAKDYSYSGFLKYLNLVFSYAGTLSLEKELVKVNDNQVHAGDVFIHGGSPGHCFIVLEVCADKNGRQKFLLAQSFMPAQNIQVLQDSGNPWFSLTAAARIPYGDLISTRYQRRFK